MTLQQIVMKSFKEHIMAYINNVLLNKQKTFFDKYKHVMENKFLVELDGSPQYNELRNFKRFSKWFQCKVSM